MSVGEIESFLPGVLWVSRGTVGDYRGLERFHYRSKGPATWAGVWVVRYEEERHVGTKARRHEGRGEYREEGRVVAVAVLSYPTVNSGARDRALGMERWERGRKLRFVNEHVRTISRVVVHPQFRGVGLASRLVRYVCAECPTRWVEAYAVMGRVHPFFEKGGMVRMERHGGTEARRHGGKDVATEGRSDGAREGGDGPVYYLLDRETHGTSSVGFGG
jgi:GNAT superfamily N-acetyltransferase